MTLQQLRERRAQLAQQARAIIDAAQTAARELTNEERTSYDGFMGQLDTVNGDIRRLEQAETLNDPATHGTRPSPNDPTHRQLGMSQSDLRSYSLVRAIDAMADHLNGNRNSLDRAGLEMEASRAMAKRLGRDPQGFFVPTDWLNRSLNDLQASGGNQQELILRALQRLLERRDLLSGTPTAGGNTVATDLLSDNFIELLRNRMVLRAAGATMLGDLSGNGAIPRQSGGATSYWVAENDAPTESQQTVDQVTLTPKTVGAFTDYSRRLLRQSSIDVEAFVRGDLSAVGALAIDRAGFHGLGSSNQPTGIALTSGSGSVAGGPNGLAPTWGHMVSVETEVAIDNADLGRLAYITNAKVRGKLKQTPRVSGQDRMIWNDDNTLNGYATFTTNQVRSDLDKGTSTGVCSAAFFGNWADLLIGMWGGLDILVDPYTGSTAGTVRVVALQDVDVAVRHPESFAAMLDALTT